MATSQVEFNDLIRRVSKRTDVAGGVTEILVTLRHWLDIAIGSSMPDNLTALSQSLGGNTAALAIAVEAGTSAEVEVLPNPTSTAPIPVAVGVDTMWPVTVGRLTDAHDTGPVGAPPRSPQESVPPPADPGLVAPPVPQAPVESNDSRET